MNSTISDDFTRGNLASEAYKCVENLQARTQILAPLQKELSEINLSIAAYIEESKKRLERFRLNLAHEARSSQKVVEILSNKCKMSNLPGSPQKRSTRSHIKSLQEDNNNTNIFTDHQRARAFAHWFQRMIDDDRQNFIMYIAEDATLEWFGRTIKPRKKVATFLKYDMQCSKHYFSTVESTAKIQWREESIKRQDKVESPLYSPELIRIPDHCGKRKLRSNCNSPEWAEGCKPDDDEVKSSERKRLKRNHADSVSDDPNSDDQHQNVTRRLFNGDDMSDIDNKGDGMLRTRLKRKLIAVTPPNREIGQGDCLPSTSGTESNKSHEVLNAQLPKLTVQCNGYIEFNCTKNNRSCHSMKRERKCKVQISYSEDPLNIGEYIVWALRYSDDTKCRRNLLAAFEEASSP